MTSREPAGLEAEGLERIVLGNWSRVAMLASMASSTTAAARPLCSTVTATYSPLGVCTRRTAETGTPLPWQKPSSARVGWPSAS